MHRSKRKRNLIIFSLVGVLLCMVAGYAAFQTQLKVTGSSTVTSNWDIEITNVTAGTPTGSAENAVAPSFDKLWASMEANLYDKGDAMEYDVTIENKGTLDAKLNDIITNLDNSNNEAVIITFSGYTKGEVLKAKTSKVVHVKIEYNPEYEGGETSSEVEINFDYGQNNNEENNPDSQYLLTYDYSTNGGTSVELTEELIASGSNVDLSNTATKEGWTFVGWNTDKDAQIGLENYQMPASNTTLYAIYSKTLKVTYEKGENIDSIGKNEDSCNIYNNQTSCEVTLPEITVSDDSVTVGWYNGEDKIGEPNDKYTITNDITLRAEAQFEPIIQSWSSIASTDFHAEEYRTNIITATFLDNKEVPEGATSWDVSAEKNGSVMAWVIPDETDSAKYHLYIGGDGGVIANQDSSYLFRNFTNLQTITFGDNFDTSKVTSMNRMFQSCNKLTTLDVSQWDTSNVTNMISMFENCRSLTTLDVSNWNTSNVIRMDSMFYSCSSLTTLDVSNWNISNVTNMYSMFSYCSSLTTLDVSQWDTSNVTNMRGMFSNCSSLTTLDVSNWDTSNVTNMQSMFYNCSSLTTLDISKFDTSNVTYMSFMFSYCSSLTTLDVSKWNTSNVTNMGNMFEGCSSLTTIDLSNWNTSNVTTMQQMFNYCSSLITLDVSKWNTSSVTNMQSMFSDCSSLTKLVLCSFDTNKATDMDYMFEDSSNLKSIYVGSNWTTENATTTDMFTGSGVSEVTQSNNCEYDAEEMSLEISTTSTTNSITVVATAYADSGIAKYEYSKDGGKAWEESTNNTYTFTGLTTGTAYDIKVRVTSNIGKVLEQTQSKSTNSLALATFTAVDTDNGKTVTITYPNGCGDSLTCSYQKDNGSIVNVTSSTVNVEFTDSGSLVANVSDGTNTSTSTYTVVLTFTSEDLKELVVTTGDGLYKDEYEEGKYFYKGATPNNYVTFNGEDAGWRIISINPDNTIKIMKIEGLGSMRNDSGGVSWAGASLNTYLNEEYINTITINKEKIVESVYAIGGIEDQNEDLSKQISDENSHTWTGMIGLPIASEYIRTNSNMTECGTAASIDGSSYCTQYNWMTHYSGNILTINPPGTTTWLGKVSYGRNAGTFNMDGAGSLVFGMDYAQTYPVLNLSADTKLQGTGSESVPFTIVN